MNASTIRQTFLDFFQSKQHKIVPSAPIVLKNDPTLMFTNSGMVQFKDYFLGNATPAQRRVADTQKCLRVSGKHNDLEDVGLDTYHHTMFEMLGNWSFGDYFKKEAIEWAWELLTEKYKLPKDRLYVSVFGGDKADNLPADEEARGLWEPIVGKERIIYGNKKDNFWEMGESGPCGPCSEIHIDMRPDEERKKKSGYEMVNTGDPRVIEIWNLVFMQFNRLASGELLPLPEKHVDTGMGFERLCMAIQQKFSTYDTDVFTPLIREVEKWASVSYGQQEKTDIAIRVVVDHIRAVSFAMADGQLPSNTGAGYVIRRILRRAIRYSYSHLNLTEPVLYQLVNVLAEQMKLPFPELFQQKKEISQWVHEEEKAFIHTLEKGLKRVDQLLQELPQEKSKRMISGQAAFELFDTFGFPFDLTQLLAREQNATVDENGFLAEMQKQKERSKTDAQKETGDWEILSPDNSEFIGYDTWEVETTITRYRKIKQKNKTYYQIALKQNPFYGESGGQVGDRGWLHTAQGAIAVVDTKKENDLILVLTEKLPEQKLKAHVDKTIRLQTMCNHSATHLLHAALRNVLGHHVAQKGSLVNEQMLRFDFSHFGAMTADEIQQVEEMVNQKIRENIALDEKRNVPIEQAKSMGAMALFGEKYGDAVRVITFDKNFSVELCGGTHVRATGQIGYFKIVSESSIASGVRRIEAVTGAGAEAFIRQELHTLHEIRQAFKMPKQIEVAVFQHLQEKRDLEKKLEAQYQLQAVSLKDSWKAKLTNKKEHHVLIEKISVSDTEIMKNAAYALKNDVSTLVLVLAATVESQPYILIMLGDEVVKADKLHAGKWIKELAKEIGGGGGGQPFFAMAGGKNLDGLDRVVEIAKKELEKL